MLPVSKQSTWDALVASELNDVFAHLGLHPAGKQARVTVFVPGSSSISLLDRAGTLITAMQCEHPAGVFTCKVQSSITDYQLGATIGTHTFNLEDPYRFDSLLNLDDVWLFSEGRLEHAQQLLGARLTTHLGVKGVHFAVWAPNARRVAVVGDFNHFDSRTHVLRFHPDCGIWEMFVPGPIAGNTYRFDIIGQDGERRQKADPYARAMLSPADSVAVITTSSHIWADDSWMTLRKRPTKKGTAVSIYEVHAGSWQRDEAGAALDYTRLSDELLDYVLDMGFTHIQFMPLGEHPFSGSWGYQPIGLFAPTSRFGSTDMLKALIDKAHQRGIGVLLDWVPAHFPNDSHGLVRFDGSALYEHEDPRRGEHPDWGTLIYNYGRSEVLCFLISNALFWVEEFHLDGLRVDAVASMLYLDYSRKSGEWLPNEHGGRENFQAVRFLQRVNEAIHSRYPGVMTIAEESTAWPRVTVSVPDGGLGFSLKWNMGWMNDTLGFVRREPVHRRHHHNEITFSMMYAYSEQYVLPFSHDEVVHGKASLLGKMPGDRWQQLANLRSLFAYLWSHPGKKHLFMGCEIGEPVEWNHDGTVNWSLLAQQEHRGLQHLVKDLNSLYRRTRALHAADHEPAGFNWCTVDDVQNSVIAFERRDPESGSAMLVVLNFTPVVRHGYEVTVSSEGVYREVLNTDSAYYSGSNVGNQGRIATRLFAHGPRLALTLPPLAALFLAKEVPAGALPVEGD